MLRKIFLICNLYFVSLTCGQGSLFIIGGGDRPDYMMKKFVELSGGANSSILIIPFASSDPVETGKRQSEEMKKNGASESDYLSDSTNIDSIENLEKIKKATGIFFSGGDQNKLTKLFLRSKAYDLIMKKFKEGIIIGGTSAGAAIMSKIMITGYEKKELKDNPFARIKKETVCVLEGFGFIDWAIVDQHFVMRKRHNRLISVVLENPSKIGIGIDEATAIIVNSSKKSFKVIGESGVIVYDARKAKIKENKNGILGADSIEMKILIDGEEYFFENKN